MPKKKKDEAGIVIPKGAMVDTNVLIHAVNTPDPNKHTAEQHQLQMEKHQSCRYLLAQMPIVRVSAVTWIEFMRFDPAAQEARIRALADSFDILTVDDEAARLAAALLHRKFGTPHICPRCFSHTVDKPTPCPRCKAVRAPRQHHVDATIVACASTYRVPTLFSYDSDFATYQRLLKSEDGEWCVNVVPPPNLNGPLDEWAKKSSRPPQVIRT